MSAPGPDETLFVSRAYDGSNVTFRVLRAYGWGQLLNLGWYPFRRPLSLLNLVLTRSVLVPRHRLPAAQTALVRRALRLLAPGEGDAVLDVGCGRGGAASLLAHEHPGVTVTGVDLLPENVAVATTLHASPPDVVFRAGDAGALDLRDGVYDRVLCLESAFHFSDRARFLAEIRRVTRPGGRVVLVDFVADEDVDDACWETEAARTVREIWQFERFETLRGYRAHAGAAGLDLVAVRDWTAHVTEPIQSIFDTVAWLGRRRWGRRVMVAQNRMLRSLTDDDWEAFQRSSRAHRWLRERSRYVAMAFELPASS